MKAVISLSRNSIVGAVVDVGHPPRIVSRHATPWNQKTLEQIITKLVVIFAQKRISIVLADDIAYTVMYLIPKSIREQDERQVVFKKLRTQVPEELTDTDWDYKEVKIKDGKKQVVAFTPVQEVFSPLSSILHKLGCVVEAVEPASVAITRNPDPIIGVALKQDIRGKDKDTLNISLVDKRILQEDPSSSSTDTGRRGTAVYKSYIMIFGIILACVVVFGVIMGSRLVQRKNTSVIPTPTPVAQPESPTPTPMSVLQFSQYAVQVLNGSGVSGQAGYVADQLKLSGFTNVDVGNADEDTVDTIVRIKESTMSAKIFQKVQEILSEYVVNTHDLLQKEYPYDLLVIVGRKK